MYRRCMTGAMITACVYTVLMGVSVGAYAHGTNPAPRDVQVLGDGQWLLVTTFGVITSEQPDRYVCEEAFLGSEDFLVLGKSTQQWSAFSRDHVIVTTDGGCSFQVKMELEQVPDAVAMSSGGHQAMLYDGKLFWSDDLWESEHHHDLASLGDIQWTGLRFMDESTVYLAGYSREEASRGDARLFHFDISGLGDAAQQDVMGAKYPYIFGAAGGELAGIASVEGELSLLWGEPSQWLASRQALDAWPVDGSLSPDGASLAMSAASADGEVVVYGKDGESVVSVAGESSSCVAWSDDAGELLQCASNASQPFALARVSEREVQDVLVDFNQIKGPVTGCAQQTAATKTCALVWPDLARTLRIDVQEEPLMDMGQSDEDMSPDAGGVSDDMGGGFYEENEPDMGSSQGGDDTSGCNSSGLSQNNDSGFGWGVMMVFLALCGVRIRGRSQGMSRTR